MFVRIELIQSGLIPFSSIRTNSIALGKNLLVTRVGNKGGVSCHLDLNPAVFCPSLPSPLPLRFVCCHLAADTNGESKLDRRNRDAKYAHPPLLSPSELVNAMVKDGSAGGFAFVLGDLNYRIDMTPAAVGTRRGLHC